MKTKKKKLTAVILISALSLALLAAAAGVVVIGKATVRETRAAQITPEPVPTVPPTPSPATPTPTATPVPTATPKPTPVPDSLPVLTILGNDPLELTARPWPYEDPGCTAWDEEDGDLTDRIVTETDVSPYHAGIGTVTYTVTDSAGQTVSARRIVLVHRAPRPEIVEPEERVVYLTFDDGPSAYTMRLLDILDKYDVKATFFVVGIMEDYLPYIREMAARGHTVAIHSFTHDYGLIYSGEEAYFADLTAMQDIIYEQTGRRPTLVRFPGGSSNTASLFNRGIMTTLARDLGDMGYRYFDWNVSAQDASTTANGRTTVNNIKKYLDQYPHAVVLMHETQLFSVNAVPEIIRYARSLGYEFRALDPSAPTVHHPLAN